MTHLSPRRNKLLSEMRASHMTTQSSVSRTAHLTHFASRSDRKLEVEDLFYTSSKYRFWGALKLWLAESGASFFSDQKKTETNFFVSKNRVVSSKIDGNADQDKINQALLDRRVPLLVDQKNTACRSNIEKWG